MSTYAQPERAMFLGTLTSDVADESLLPPGFQVLRLRFDELWNLYVDKQITRDQFAEQLRALRVVGADGFEWTIGATTRRWHRRSVDGSWIVAPPPLASEISAPIAVNRDQGPAVTSPLVVEESVVDEEAVVAEESTVPEVGISTDPAGVVPGDAATTPASDLTTGTSSAVESPAAPEDTTTADEPAPAPVALPEPLPYSGPVAFEEDEEPSAEQPRYGGLPDNRAPDRFRRFTPVDIDQPPVDAE